MTGNQQAIKVFAWVNGAAQIATEGIAHPILDTFEGTV